MVTSLKSIAENSGTSIRNVRTALKNFEETYEFLTSISTNRNRLITITNWELYQSNNEKPTSKLTGNRQASDKQVTTNKNDKNDKNDKNIYSSEIIRMAEKLKSLILENNPGARTPKDLTKWQSEFDKMKRLDKRTDEQIYAVMEFSQTDPFWKSNILSAKKLREKFDTLILQKDRNKPQNKFKPPQAANFEQRQYSDKDFDNLYKEV